MGIGWCILQVTRLQVQHGDSSYNLKWQEEAMLNLQPAKFTSQCPCNVMHTIDVVTCQAPVNIASLTSLETDPL